MSTNRQNQEAYAMQLLSKTFDLPLSEDRLILLNNFLDGIEGCPWSSHETKRDKRMFETSLKTWFPEFEKELVQYHLTNSTTINGKSGPFKSINLHTMDDQGFEGQIMDDGSFYRWANDWEVLNK